MSQFDRLASRAAGLLLLAGVALSATASTFVVTEEELHPDLFPAVAGAIRANLEGPNSPQGLTRAERQRVEDSLDRMQAMLAEDPVRHHSRIRTLQRQVNTALTPRVAQNTAQSDVVCQRVKKVGTNIPTTECTSRAQRESDAYLAREEIFRLTELQALEDTGLPGNDGRIK